MSLINKLKQLFTQISNNRLYRKIDDVPFMTEGILAIIIFVYVFGIVTNSTDSIINYGAMYRPLVQFGQWWRFITPIFIHLSFLHILMNGISLYYVGIQLEKIFGHIRFLVIFMLSGIFGNIAGFAFSNGASAGASTAIFGLFGVFLMLGETFHDNMYVRRMSQSFLLLIVLNIGFDLMSPDIDIIGHIGGLIAGFLLPYVVGLPSEFKIPMVKKILSLIVLLVFAYFCLKTGYFAN